MAYSIYRKPDIKRVTGGLSDVTIRALEEKGHFPRRFKLNPHGKTVGWLVHEVDEWCLERAASRESV